MIVNGERRETKKPKSCTEQEEPRKVKPEERQTRLERCRYAAMNTKQRRNLTQRRMLVQFGAPIGHYKALESVQRRAARWINSFMISKYGPNPQNYVLVNLVGLSLSHEGNTFQY